MTIQEELQQTRPFARLEEEALVSLARTTAKLEHAFGLLLKPFGLTPTQYNILRILRGAGENGLCRNEIGKRLISMLPDVTRLLDRMESAELILRQRETEDRRYVRTVITPKGLELLAKIDVLNQEHLTMTMSGIDEVHLKALIAILDRIRENLK